MQYKIIIKNLKIVNGEIEGDITLNGIAAQIVDKKSSKMDEPNADNQLIDLFNSLPSPQPVERLRKKREPRKFYCPRSSTYAFSLSDIARAIKKYSKDPMASGFNAEMVKSELYRAHLKVMPITDNRGINVSYTDREGVSWLNQIYQFAIL